MSRVPHIAVIGGGAAGFFFAANLAEQAPGLRITILERAGKVLEKVRISGGGRCNVCHAEYDPRQLVKSYPRGNKALRGPFHRFCSGDTQAWFEDRGVPIKTEEDGRMFPASNDSASIVDTLRNTAEKGGVRVRLRANVSGIKREGGLWSLRLADGSDVLADAVLIAPGSSPRMWEMLADLGHKIVEPVPSLFTFRCKDPRIEGLMGVAVNPAEVRVNGTKLRESGPVLITHWGFSGPAVLRTSAWGARDIAALNYDFTMRLAWVPNHNAETMRKALWDLSRQEPRKAIVKRAQFGLPGRLWQRLCEVCGIAPDQRWADLRKDQANQLTVELTQAEYPIKGKTTFKDEFVTSGGIDLREVNFKTMESKLLPGIYFAGEFLDIDAITGGFNFQAAWTTSFIAAEALCAQFNI